jgi:ABC-type branched-subunit amino acid transport system ATPase component
MQSLIEAKGLTAGYKGVPAIRNITMSVKASEIVLLLGPNGAGKSTTCLTLAGAMKPMSGEVRSRDEVVSSPVHTRVRAGMGFLPERRAIFPSLTVRENLRLGRSSVDGVLKLFPELEKRLGVKAGLLSGGEQQMLTLGRVLAAEPQFVLVDELSLGLAPIIVTRLLEALRSQADAGVGVLLIEQHVHSALRYGDRAYFLRRGEVAFEGECAALASDHERLAELYL